MHQERVKLKIELEALARQHKDIQEKVRNHSKICDAKAKEKIDIEQEVIAVSNFFKFGILFITEKFSSWKNKNGLKKITLT